MFDVVKGSLAAAAVVVVFALTVPWLSRLIDIWVEYKNWVLGL